MKKQKKSMETNSPAYKENTCREQAFEVFYQALCRIEEAGEDEVYHILSKYLLHLSGGCCVSLASVDSETGDVRIESIACGNKNDSECSVENTGEIIEKLINTRGIQNDLIDIKDRSVFELMGKDECLAVPSGHSCYRIATVKQKKILALGVIVMDKDSEPENPDIISNYLHLMGMVLQRINFEKALKKSESNLRAIIDAATDAIFIKDRDMRYIRVNPAIKKAFYLEAGDFIGNTDYEIFGREFGLKSRSIDYRVLKGEVVEREEMIEVDGKAKFFHFINAPLHDESGEIYGLCGIARDVTDRKMAEEEIKRFNEELESRVAERTASLENANAELLQYAYVVSHDLKTPLRAIHNYTEFLREDLEDSLDEEQKMYMESLCRAVFQADNLVNDLLEHSKIDRRDLKFETIHTGVFISKLLNSMDLPEEIRIVMGNEWPSMEIEPTIFSQIFQNLISNAIKFNKSKTKIVEIGCRHLGGGLYEFHVRDNGIGIAPRYQKQIFGMFQRLHTSKEYEGTGIGLAIVKKAVEKLNGRIRIESATGEGTTFYVVIPDKYY